MCQKTKLIAVTVITSEFEPRSFTIFKLRDTSMYYDDFNLNVQFVRFLAYLLFSYISKFFQLSNSKYYPTYINCGISVAFYRPDLRSYDVKNIKGLPLTLNFNSNFLMAHFPWQDFVQQHRHFKSLFLMQSLVYLR